jgi:hypothetical protein
VNRPFTASVRVIPNIGVDRARTRINLAWRASPRWSLAAEYNPGADEFLPNFNFSPVLPGELLPGVGVIVGTSSDRIGTPDGRAWFATASLDPSTWTGLPINGYLGASYGTYANDVRAIGGATWWINDRFSAGFIHDGENLHWIGSCGLGELGPGHAIWQADLLLIEQDGFQTLGATLSTRF